MLDAEHLHVCKYIHTVYANHCRNYGWNRKTLLDAVVEMATKKIKRHIQSE